MGRLLIFIAVALILDVFAIVDLALIDKTRVRAFPKVVWVIIIVVVPFIGALLWFVIGHGWGIRGGERRVIAPDDDPSFLKNIRRDEEQDERIRRLEQELADLDDDPPQN